MPKQSTDNTNTNHSKRLQTEGNSSKKREISDKDRLNGECSVQLENIGDSLQFGGMIVKPTSSGKQTTTTTTTTTTTRQLKKKASVLKIPNNAAVRSTPDGLQVAPSGIPRAGLGVWTKQEIPIGTMFGPYEGAKIFSEIDARHSGYAWEVNQNGKLHHYIDGRSVKRSNWMRYVNSALHESDQNVQPVQYVGEIYYRACIDIPRNVELLTWYGDHYAEEMGLLKAPSTSTVGVSASTHASKVEPHAGKMLNFRKDSNQQPSGMHSTGMECRSECGPSLPSAGNKELTGDKKHAKQVDDKPKPHQCTFCTKSFAHKSQLAIHVRIHTRETPYGCTECGMKFSYKGSLKTHMRIHTGEKPYKCIFCGMAFSYPYQMKKHVSSHTRNE